MAEPDEERMEALSEAIRRLLARQQETERRLARVEQQLNIRETPAPRPAAAQRPPVPRGPHFETRLGLTLLNRVGVLTLVIGIAFFFKYAVDNRWIGETGRVTLGILAGLSALGIADRFWRRHEAIFAQGICGAGIAILYVSFYAAFSFYGLIPHALAFLLMALNTAAAGALALRYDSAAIAGLGLVGGYLTPVVLSTGAAQPWALFAYVLLLDLGALALARTRARNWQGLEALAMLATAGLYWSWLIASKKADHAAAETFAVLYYALFALSRWRVVFVAAQFLGVLELMVVSLPQPLPFLPLATLISAAGLAVADRRRWVEAPLAAFLAFWLPYAPAHFVVREHGSPETIFYFITLVFLLFLAWLPWRILVRKQAPGSLDLLLVPLNAAFYFGTAYSLLDPAYHAWLGLFAAALAALHLGLAREIRDARELRPALLYLGVAVALLTLAAPVQFTGYRITMAWALEAAALAWIGARASERWLGWASLAVLALALLRLLAIDSWIYPNPHSYGALRNARFVTFLTAAVAFWLAARWIAVRRAALAPYIAGHLVLLWALTLEVVGWAARNTAPADIQNVESTAISILLAAYAVLLVGLGVATRSALNRVLGLGLIAVVVLKLYTYDVWRLSRGMYRVAAFAALGAFLLMTSYLYSRYRGSIESWWRDEDTRR